MDRVRPCPNLVLTENLNSHFLAPFHFVVFLRAINTTPLRGALGYSQAPRCGRFYNPLFRPLRHPGEVRKHLARCTTRTRRVFFLCPVRLFCPPSHPPFFFLRPGNLVSIRAVRVQEYRGRELSITTPARAHRSRVTNSR